MGGISDWVGSGAGVVDASGPALRPHIPTSLTPIPPPLLPRIISSATMGRVLLKVRWALELALREMADASQRLSFWEIAGTSCG